MEKTKKIKQIAFVLATLAIGAILFPNDAFAVAGINKQLSYQAVLKTSAGVNVADGDFDILFKIYSVSTGGSPLWTGTHTATNGNAVTVTDGVFSELLGSGTGNTMTIDFTDDTLYLGITIGADPEMTPRKRIGASGYAFNADTLDGIDSLSFLRSDAVDTMSASSTSAILTITQTGAGDILNVFDGATEVFTILDGGNVGIGTATPGKPLHLDTTSANGPDIFFTDADTGSIVGSDGLQLGMDDGEHGFFWNYESAGDIYFGAGNAEVMRLDSSGNVGIGASTPADLLHIAGGQLRIDNDTIPDKAC